MSGEWIQDCALSTAHVLMDVSEERERQTRKWGEQHHLDHCPYLYREWDRWADNWKAINDRRVQKDELSWDGILLEEVYEALAETDPAMLREELVQVAAVAVAWIEDIDSREVSGE